jgi:uncharacterized protein
VVAAAEYLADLERLAQPDRLLLSTAAYFHDIGFVEQRADHEAAGIRIVREALPGFGYSRAQVDAVGRLLLATQLPQAPRTLSEEILADADLDVLGREGYWVRNHDLRAEWEHFGLRVTDQEWYRNQLEFLTAHRYFTRSAQRLREAHKQANIAHLRVLLNGHGRATEG